MSTEGRAWVYGDNVDTDGIIPARYLTGFDPAALARHCMEDLDTTFATEVTPGDVIVAGENFGCGSSREHAPLAIKASGIGCIIAKSFARIFYRNALNIGLPILESRRAVDGIETGHRVGFDLASGEITDLTTGKRYQAIPHPPFMRELLAEGGLIAYTRKRIASGSLPDCTRRRASTEEGRTRSR
jgi:3-isopropylmalate/(R)-2-methylmalate dehydratase small subunit